ncbi:CheR family methyltransferase [Paenibacillus sp. GCM10012307]|uniref:protein-glutamate O-methyltransferase n=1 Tax=Paenibacillus roseus TaxID=2798579 RepID=A0A934J4K6_9BACL|nr:protein-glutamate O-methyltransferase CheR [Paenibacillus roseus]MBJ6360305.1 protein-glutamate O-methyltransferase CheR [Paenibacillus roseus]
MAAAITQAEFKRLAEHIQAHYGIYLKDEKKSMLVSRLDPLLSQYGLGSFEEFYRYVLNDKSGEAATRLIDRITTNHTYFMREAGHFRFLQEKALSELVPLIKNKDLRIWSAGCSSGQEPYTLAMIIDQFFESDKHGWDTKLLATDLSPAILATAIRGEYTSEEISTLPASWRSLYFKRTAKGLFTVNDALKKEIIFRKFNLMDEVFPFKSRFHIIYCRNVMIYFDAETKLRLLKRFHQFLETGGYLFIGHSESIDRRLTGFRYVMPAVYRKE